MTMKDQEASWKNPPYNNDDGAAYEQLCQQSTPVDFIFFVKPNPPDNIIKTMIVVTPKAYFLKEGYCWDQHMSLAHILPADFDDIMEGTYISERDPEEVRQDMLNRGFQENQKFSEFLANNIAGSGDLPAETPSEQAEHQHTEDCGDNCSGHHEHEKRFSVIEFFDLSTEKYDEESVSAKVQAKIGTSLQQMKETLSATVIKKAEELSLEFPNIAPLGNYGKLIEDNDGMTEFLKTEGHQPKHWEIELIEFNPKLELLMFSFANKGVDDGTTFSGFVYTTKGGKIKHSFAKVNE